LVSKRKHFSKIHDKNLKNKKTFIQKTGRKNAKTKIKKKCYKNSNQREREDTQRQKVYSCRGKVKKNKRCIYQTTNENTFRKRIFFYLSLLMPNFLSLDKF
jgi:hypothetical protein